MGDPLGLKAYLAMAKLVGILILIGIVCYQSSQIHKWHTQSDKQVAARVADRASYEAAQRQAADKNKADVLAKEQQYKRNNDEAVGNLNARIERLRHELSAQPSTAPGSAGGSNLPQADNPSGATGQAGVCLTPEELLHGATNEERFDQLITLILKQTR